MIIKKIPCEVYSRVTGYYRRVDQWNKGKQEEFRERKGVLAKRIEKKLDRESS